MSTTRLCQTVKLFMYVTDRTFAQATLLSKRKMRSNGLRKKFCFFYLFNLHKMHEWHNNLLNSLAQRFRMNKRSSKCLSYFLSLSEQNCTICPRVKQTVKSLIENIKIWFRNIQFFKGCRICHHFSCWNKVSMSKYIHKSLKMNCR